MELKDIIANALRDMDEWSNTPRDWAEEVLTALHDAGYRVVQPVYPMSNDD